MATYQIVLVSGATAGLGLEIVKALCASPQRFTILVAGRSLDKASAAISEATKSHPETQSQMVPLKLDVESDQNIAEAASYVDEKYGKLDVLINNAGASFEQAITAGTSNMTLREAFNKDWEVNVTSAHLMTQAMMPLLLKSSRPRLIFMTSGTCSLTETEDEKMYFNKIAPAGLPKPAMIVGYRSCKTGLNMVMREWHRLLRNDGVLVWAISPGFLATGLGASGSENLKKMGALDPSVGGHFVKEVVEGKRDADAGKVIRSDGIQPW